MLGDEAAQFVNCYGNAVQWTVAWLSRIKDSVIKCPLGEQLSRFWGVDIQFLLSLVFKSEVAVELCVSKGVVASGLIRHIVLKQSVPSPLAWFG